jgi:two-component system, NarL family, response regulator NreC
MSIKIILTDDHKIVREGLRTLLEKHPEFEVVGEADNGRTAIALAQQLQPDVMIIDVTMPDLNGIDATELLMEKNPALKIIGLSMHFEKRFIARMLAAGASGYLRKACASEDIILAIHTILKGKYFISDGNSNMTFDHKEQYLEQTLIPDTTMLTGRERELLQLIAEGKLTKDIANILCISIKTVEKHRENLMKKLRARSLAELLRIAIREGIVSFDE